MSGESVDRYLLTCIVAGVATGAALCSFAQVYRSRRSITTKSPPSSNGHPIAGIELGGTTSVAALCHPSSPTVLIDKLEIPTTSPDETIGQILRWLEARAPFSAIGVVSFGPLDLQKKSPSYGSILNTPKKMWANFPLLASFRPLAESSCCDLAFDTDVNAPAMAELVHCDRKM